MTQKATVRSLLAFMEISEFDADVSRRLFARAQKTAAAPAFSLFQRVVLAGAMWLSAAAFYQAMSLYLQTCEAGTLPLVRAGAGLAVFLFAASVAALTKNPVWARFVWSAALGAEILFLSGVYALSPAGAVICAAVVFGCAAQSGAHVFRSVSSACVFAAVLMIASWQNASPSASFFAALPTFVLGAAAAVYPCGGLAERRVVFALLPAQPITFIIGQAAALAGADALSTGGGAVAYVLAAAGLAAYVRRYMTPAERGGTVRALAVYALLACLFPAGAVGALLIAVIGRLTDFAALFYAGVVLFALSFLMYVLSLPLSFGAAAFALFVLSVAAFVPIKKCGGEEK